MHSSIDTSTLNIEKIKQLPTYKLPPTYRLGSYGSGCAFDAPGFPSYMVQPIYTGNGGSPRKAPDAVLELDGTLYILRGQQGGDWDAHYALYQKRLHSLWVPLPMDHVRVQMWMKDAYRHWHHCYRDVERPEYKKPGTLIYPIPYYKLARPSTIKITPGTPEAEVTKIQYAIQCELDRVKAENEFEEMRAKRIAIPENHQAVLHIQKFYPEYQPNLEWIANPPESEGRGSWWETAAERPNAETCTPRNSLMGGGWNWRHPKEPGHHCHFCGRTNPSEESSK